MQPRHALPILLVALALALSLAGCGGSSSSDGTGSETTTAAAATTTGATTTAETTTTATTTETATTALPTTIALTVVEGKPAGGILRPTVSKGEHVELVVASDTAGEIHLHGYDLSADVEAGGTARIAFTATAQGRFEVELENTGVQIAEITVR
jgi:hypothetical protein